MILKEVKKILIFVILAFLCFELTKSSSPCITLSELTSNQWNFYNSGGMLGRLKLQTNGTISGYGNFNEMFWTFDGKVLSFLNGDREPTSRLRRRYQDSNGKWIINGPYLFLKNWKHELIQSELKNPIEIQKSLYKNHYSSYKVLNIEHIEHRNIKCVIQVAHHVSIRLSQVALTVQAQIFSISLYVTATTLGAVIARQVWRFIQKEASFQGISRLFQSIFILTFILLIILYNLKVKLPISYRVFSGLQTVSCLIYSRVIYLEYEDFFVLRYFNLLSGPYMIQYRLQSLSTDHAIQTYVLFGFFMFLLFFLYYPSQTFHKKIDSLWEYVKQNLLQYFENFYYFGGKMMFLYIGMFIQTSSKEIVLIIHLVLFCVLILFVFLRLIMEYHKNSLSEQIYQGPFYLYLMLTNAATIGIPLISQSSKLLIILLAPLGLLILITILNKDIEILSKASIKFFVVEALMGGMSVAVVLTSGSIQTFVLLAIQVICAILIFVQIGLVYYGGIDLNVEDPKSGRKNKIEPILNESVNEVQIEENKNVQRIQTDKKKKKGKYF